MAEAVAAERLSSVPSPSPNAAGASHAASPNPSPKLRPLLLASKSSSPVATSLPPPPPQSKPDLPRSSCATTAASFASPQREPLTEGGALLLSPAPSYENPSEQWAIPADSEGALVRKTYAYFDKEGISGDGFVEGNEFTRQKCQVYPWERLRKASARHSAPRPSQLGAGSVWREGKLEVGLTHPDDRHHSTQSSALSAPATGEEDLAELASATSATTLEPAAEGTGGEEVPVTASSAEEVSSEGYDELINRIDRYGFFSSNLSTRIAQGRVVVLHSAPFKKLPKVRSARRVTSSPLATSGLDAFAADEEVNAAQKAAEVGFSKRNSAESQLRKKELGRIAKWEKMLVPIKSVDEPATRFKLSANTNARKVRRRVFKGIPDRWRAAVWEALIRQQVETLKGKGWQQSSQATSKLHSFAQAMHLPSSHDVQIDLDVPRTINGHILFHTRYGLGQRNLFRVLHTFSLLCDACAYCQGMGPIAATFLCYLLPEQAYTSMVGLHDAYGLHKVFKPGFPGLVELFYVQRQLMQAFMPDVLAKLDGHMITTSSYATKWYITLFNSVVPFDTQLRIWDAFLLEGPSVLVIVALAILWAYRVQLSDPCCSFEHTLGSLSSYFIPENDDVLMAWVGEVLQQSAVKEAIQIARSDWAKLEAEGRAGDVTL
ncbi:RabGAP/TBC [Tilletiaria anomala UBC 951]|uniref:RabGAP/TBC n=1 Tax=Tilletiaria anomala (strain ATCC 24038 / CBS 436.72 / UBC 951) TaxID=1037660 RepID=A0A066W5K7_TILAU|nr:RabGAP/TBC [Tilletiaria anomala UBC 951]KDN49252.1 RabGAP/TBC [Tilletiaria anomala UBC 951]